MPGFAFGYHAEGDGWDRLLAGRTGEMPMSMDMAPWFFKWVHGAAGNRIMAKRTPDCCGVKPLRITHFASVRRSTPDHRRTWLARAHRLGRAGVAAQKEKTP